MLWAEQFAKGTDYSQYDERDIEHLKSNKFSKIVFFDDDYEALSIIHVFKTTQFDYNQMNGKPYGFNYLMLKDNLKWHGLPPKLYLNLMSAIFNRYVSSIK